MYINFCLCYIKLREINYLVQLGRLVSSSELRSDYLQGNPHDGDGVEAGVGDGDDVEVVFNFK